MPARIVRAHYDELNKITGSFGAQAELMRKNLQELRARQATLQGGDWIGQGATAFYREMDDSVLPTLQRLVNALDAAANSTSQIRGTMKDAEDQAARVFKGTVAGGGLAAGGNAAAGLVAGASPAAGLAADASAAVAGPTLWDAVAKGVAAGAGNRAGASAADSPGASPATAPFPAKEVADTYKATRPLSKLLDSIAKWGRDASPFKIASLYIKLNKSGFQRLHEVSDAVGNVRALMTEGDGLEKGARALNKATEEQYSAEESLPPYPLETGDKAGHALVSAQDLDFVEKYYNSAAAIANDAMDTRAELDRNIQSWDAAVAQANKDNLFTRQAAGDAINDLDGHFGKEGGNFRNYLVNVRDRAARTEDFARMKQYHAASILGKWTPDGTSRRRLRRAGCSAAHHLAKQMNRNMKYVVIAMATLVLLACVCTGTPTTTTPPPLRVSTATPGSGPTPAPTETTAAAVVGQVGETVTQGKYSATVVSVETAPDYGSFVVPKSGDEFLAVEIIVQSSANTGVNVSFLDVKVKDTDGFEYDAGPLGKEPFLPTQNDLPKGEKVRGWATIEIPKQAKGLILTYAPILNLDGDVAIRFDLGR